MKYTNTYHALASFGRELLEKRSLEDGLPLISEYAKNVIKAQRCSIFIYDKENKVFWTTLADGIDRITIAKDQGIVGKTLKEKKPIFTNDPYNHEAFCSKIDKESGFVTKNIIAAPIFDSKREILGVLQLLNKEDGFDSEDVKFMIFFGHYVSGFLELTNVYLDKDKRISKEKI